MSTSAAKPSDIRILSAQTKLERFAYRSPIKFGGRVVTDVVLLHAFIEVETRDGRRATGRGSMPMGNVWAWPSKLAAPDTEAALIKFGEQFAKAAAGYKGCAHPLDITHELASVHGDIAASIVREAGLAEAMPRLAQMVAASPVEAAIHDAQGVALGQNSYNLLGKEFVAHDLGHYLTPDFAGEYLDQYTLREPKPRMPLYHLVGARSAVRRRRHATSRRRASQHLARVDRLQRSHASEDQAQRRRSRLGRRSRRRSRTRVGPGASGPRLQTMELLARLQREVRQRAVHPRLPRSSEGEVAGGIRPSPLHRATDAPRPQGAVPKTRCTRPPRSSRS
ncbi:MAG: hypothetical protein QM775_28000 [Pirellulales bacterium]